MATHRKQHFVPQCYLRAWVDRSAPRAQNPHVWLFTADGSSSKWATPERIFYETDMYTITAADGERDLLIEHGLSELEDWFVRTRDRVIHRDLAFDEEDHLRICAFISAMMGRTKVMRDHQRKQWSRVLDKMEHLRDWAKTATAEEKKRAMLIGSSSAVSHTYDDVKAFVDHPVQSFLPSTISELTPLLFGLDLVVLTTNDDVGFITSDNPCVWFDPEGYKRPPFYRAPGLIYESIEITFPVSPSHCILLNRKGVQGYVAVPPRFVDDMNRRTRFHAGEYFVVRKKEKRDIWFDPGVEPEDSWERLHKDEIGDWCNEAGTDPP